MFGRDKSSTVPSDLFSDFADAVGDFLFGGDSDTDDSPDDTDDGNNGDAGDDDE